MKNYKLSFENISIYVLGFILFVYPYLPLLKKWSFILGTLLDTILLILLCISAFVVEIKRYKSIFNFPIQLILFLAFLTMYLLISDFSLFKAFSGYRCFLLYIATYIIIFSNYKEINILFLSKICIFNAFFICFGSIIQFFKPEYIKIFHETSDGNLFEVTNWKAFSFFNRSVSFMTDPNILSVYLCFSLFISLVYYRNNIYKLLISLYMIIGILFTQSRTGLFLLFILFFIYIFKKLMRKKIAIIKSLIFIFLLIPFVFCLFVNKDLLLNIVRSDTIITANGRFNKNPKNFMRIFDNEKCLLFGHGLYNGRGLDCAFENSYLITLYIFGFLGTIIFIALIILNFYKLIGLKFLPIIIPYLAANFVGDYIIIPQISLIMIIALAILYSERRNVYYGCFANNKTSRYGWG